MTPALYQASALFRILQPALRQAWSDQLTAGVVAVYPVVELEFLYSARSPTGWRSSDCYGNCWAGWRCMKAAGSEPATFSRR